MFTVRVPVSDGNGDVVFRRRTGESGMSALWVSVSRRFLAAGRKSFLPL